MNKAYENLRQQIDFSIERYYQSYDMSMLRLYYRGHARTEWDLKPSIMRSTIQENEADILTQAIDAKQWKYEASLFENIAHMQHYGYPTRFLDYSLDVDIALYFACENSLHYDSDGMLYISAYDERSAQHIDTILISDLAYLIREISVDDFSRLLLEKYDKTKEFSQYKCASDLGVNILSWIDHGFMVTPSDTEFSNLQYWNERLYNQKGAFFVFGNKLRSPDSPRSSSWVKFHKILPEIVTASPVITHPDYTIKITIPKEIKKDIMESLEQKGIDKAYIFPD